MYFSLVDYQCRMTFVYFIFVIYQCHVTLVYFKFENTKCINMLWRVGDGKPQTQQLVYPGKGYRAVLTCFVFTILQCYSVL